MFYTCRYKLHQMYCLLCSCMEKTLVSRNNQICLFANKRYLNLKRTYKRMQIKRLAPKILDLICISGRIWILWKPGTGAPGSNYKDKHVRQTSCTVDFVYFAYQVISSEIWTCIIVCRTVHLFSYTLYGQKLFLMKILKT